MWLVRMWPQSLDPSNPRAYHHYGVSNSAHPLVMANTVIVSPGLSTEGGDSGNLFVFASGAASASTVIGGSGKDTVDLLSGESAAANLRLELKGGRDSIAVSGLAMSGSILGGGAGADTYVFASTAALNGIDVLAANFVVADDKLDFSAFLPGGSVYNNAGVVEHNGSDDIVITNKLVHAATTNGAVTDLNTAAKIVAEVQGIGNAFEIGSGGKAIILAGDDSAATAGAQIWFIDDTLDGTNGTITATDVVQVATVTLDIDTTTNANFVF